MTIDDIKKMIEEGIQTIEASITQLVDLINRGILDDRYAEGKITAYHEDIIVLKDILKKLSKI